MIHDHRHCADYARASRGLPAIEPGMPLPAGTGMDRRSFVLRSAGLALSVYGAGRLAAPLLDEGVAIAAEGAPDTVLVSIFFSGGIDGMSVLAPVGDERYARLRPTLAVKDGTPFAGDERLVWHPAAKGLADLHAAGKVTVLPAVGYADPNHSHFTSRHFWETGTLDVGARTGWLGRWLDLTGVPNNPLQGLSLDGSLSPALATTRVAVASTPSPAEYTFASPGVWHDRVRGPMLQSFERLGALRSGDPITAQARQAHANAAMLREQLSSLPPDDGAVAYPAGALGSRLKALARMLDADLPVRAVTVDAQGGYDTHSSQAQSFATNLTSTLAAVTAFQADLERRALSNRVLIHLWSEFGRRPEENGAAGTDHGAAGVGFLVGDRARPVMVGEHPGLATLDQQGNLRATSDFRALYAALIRQWLGGVDPGDVLPGAERLPVYDVIRP